jgi:hypothetical protein
MQDANKRVYVRLVGASSLPPAELMTAVVNDPLPNMFVPWRWVPGVSHVETRRGTWNEEGAQRLLHTTDSHQMLETAISVRPGRGFIYELSEFTNALGFFFTRIEDVWWFQADGAGGTQVAWTWIMHTRPGRSWLARLFATQWRRYMAHIFKASLARLSAVEREPLGA